LLKPIPQKYGQKLDQEFMTFTRCGKNRKFSDKQADFLSYRQQEAFAVYSSDLKIER
jgi:hypothetical protein